MSSTRNLVNFKDVGKRYGSREILEAVTLGVNEGDRIGVVGRNGDGKSTLLRLIAGVETPDVGQVTRTGGLSVKLLSQADEPDSARTIREELIGDLAEHEWAGDAAFTAILDGLTGGFDAKRFPDGLDTRLGRLSGGERRRVALAKVLLDAPELLLLDEPTNHLDVEGVDWLARHLNERGRTLVVVTHDRWFLDAVCDATWEVADRAVHRYDGGYAAYVLAKAERERQAEVGEARRRALIRKELAWLRRGPPARTTKPKFRVEAANELIADEPPPRNSVELLQFATARLGNRVIDAINVSFGFDGAPVLDRVTWRLGPGERIGLVGVNGAGKSTLLRLIAGELRPTTGSVKRGQTVRVAQLTQDAGELPEQLNVFEALEDAKLVARLSDGKEITAKMLCDRFGFGGGRARTPVADLSGGERRRLQLMRLMMREPNVLLLDEPTNDLDIETLNALEDLLDSWPGTLIVVSHDRYFIERVCDNVWGLLGDGRLRHLPGGVDQYVELRRRAAAAEADRLPSPPAKAKAAGGAVLHRARKNIQRIERKLAKLETREAELEAAMQLHATDHERLAELQEELTRLRDERETLETAWLESAELVDAAGAPSARRAGSLPPPGRV